MGYVKILQKRDVYLLIGVSGLIFVFYFIIILYLQ